MRWFRMHSDAVDDPKLKLLAFEDRWHFVAICCLKCDGLLDDESKAELRDRMVAAKLGLAVRDADEVRRRLMEVTLIDENWQPMGWNKRQYVSDNSTERVRQFRQRKQQSNGVKRRGNVSVTSSETDTDTEIGNTGTKRTRRFEPPTVEQVAAYVAERRSGVDPQKFVDFYESKGWMVGKNKMKDWKAAARTWERGQEQKQADPYATRNRI